MSKYELDIVENWVCQLLREGYTNDEEVAREHAIGIVENSYHD